MNATEALMANALLVKTLTDACLAAMKAGLSKEEVSAVLARLQELIDNADD